MDNFDITVHEKWYFQVVFVRPFFVYTILSVSHKYRKLCHELFNSMNILRASRRNGNGIICAGLRKRSFGSFHQGQLVKPSDFTTRVQLSDSAPGLKTIGLSHKNCTLTHFFLENTVQATKGDQNERLPKACFRWRQPEQRCPWKWVPTHGYFTVTAMYKFWRLPNTL